MGSGPGLKQVEKKLPAGGAYIQMGGKGWHNRLADLCRSIVFDKIGEEALYEKLYTQRKIPESVCFEEMAQCGTRAISKKKVKAKVAMAASAKPKDEVSQIPKSKD